MTYRYESLGGFGAAGDWWESLPERTQTDIARFLRNLAGDLGVDSPFSEHTDRREVLAAYARSVANGGGFVVGDRCYCPPTAAGASSVPLRTSSQRCPAGTGGVSSVLEVDRMYGTSERIVVPATTTGIAGRVVNSSGSPVSGATVTVGPGGAGIGSISAFVRETTLADGRFSILRKPGTYSVAVSAPGYQGGRVPDVVVESTGVVSIGDLILLAVGESGLPPPVDEGEPPPPPVDDGDWLPPPGDDLVNGDRRMLTEVEEPWYKSPWVWVAGGLVLIVGVYAVYKTSKG